MRQVLIADDHVVARRGLREILIDLEPQTEVVEASNGDAVLALLDARAWDLILLDVMMPGPGIVELLERIRERLPEVPVLVLTASTEIEYVVETMRAGANGLIHKHEADAELAQAIGRVAAGGHYLHPDAAAALARMLADPPKAELHRMLSERELEIFRLIALGRAIKEIAFELGLSSKTVATYLARIRAKTGLAGPVEIARYALRSGLVD